MQKQQQLESERQLKKQQELERLHSEDNEINRRRQLLAEKLRQKDKESEAARQRQIDFRKHLVEYNLKQFIGFFYQRLNEVKKYQELDRDIYIEIKRVAGYELQEILK